jgi:hypothetical protein
MSISYQSKDDKVLSIALKVQELCLTSKDSIVADDSGDLLVSIGEAVEAVRMAVKVAADGTVTGVAQADISIESSVPAPAEDDQKVVRLASVSLATGDALVIKYVVKE